MVLLYHEMFKQHKARADDPCSVFIVISLNTYKKILSLLIVNKNVALY